MGRYPSAVHQHLALLSSLNPTHLLSTFGVLGVLVVIFLEMGILVAFFLPGDSLLFVAGYATVPDNSLGLSLPLGWLLLAAATGAILGGQLAFDVGRRAEATLHERPDSRFYKRAYVERADGFLRRFGAARTVVLSRFVPVIRTFASPIVGMAGMPARSYASWNAIAGVVWTVPIILLGHWLGHVPFIRHYIEALAVLVVVVSVVPAAIHVARNRSN
jgi:membrane-associated protein